MLDRTGKHGFPAAAGATSAGEMFPSREPRRPNCSPGAATGAAPKLRWCRYSPEASP
ncbi:hypothetical protein RADP37_05538 [Roseomonas mucosa]|uniref:Uncharacterized protein n=1 Tax=Roseomonas mucosa TaxID=207340 RepID=A0A4Y1MUX9_9PROT|nr:hypothetical protein RADP37_05538 [Roseomonas mucosa]